MSNLHVLVLNGPNLNLLGKREPEIYGHLTLEDINQIVVQEAEQLGVRVSFTQSNHQGVLIDTIHQAMGKCNGLLVNAGAYTHTSVGIRDAIAGSGIPTVEVHLSNIYKSEEFRYHFYIAPVSVGQISGFGADSYCLGLRALTHYIRSQV